MGTARSGSTILEILLENGKYAFGAGEVIHIPRDAFLKNNKCSCCNNCHDCNIWGQIYKKFCLSENELTNWINIQKQIDSHFGEIKLLSGLISKQNIAKYKKLNLQLIKYIYQETGCSFLIDSSKYAGRAFAMDKIAPGHVFTICLTRSPAGLLHTFQKPNKSEQKPKKPISVLMYYIVSLSALKLASLTLKNRPLYMTYEELIKSPINSMEKIEKWYGLDLINTKIKIMQKGFFTAKHIVTGNRLRKQKKIQFKSSLGEYKLKGAEKRIVLSIMIFWKKILNF